MNKYQFSGIIKSGTQLTTKEELLTTMNGLSRKYFGSQWAKGLEYLLNLQLSGFRFKGFVSISSFEEEKLRRLTQAVEGWYHWDEKKGCPVFLSWRKWYPLYNEWHFENILFLTPLKSRIDI